MTVYIPTRSRPGFVRRIVPRWLELGLDVRLVTDDPGLLRAVKRQEDWDERVHISATSAYGTGAIRRSIVKRAHAAGFRSIILADDDMMPDRNSDFRALLDIASRPRVLGIGAVRPITDHFTHGAMSANSGVILCPGGWAFGLYGLNVANAVAAGNFDPALTVHGEDAELARQGIAKLALPWLVHADVNWTSMNTRGAAGGIAAMLPDPGEREAALQECFRLLRARWGDYVNRPGSPARMAWQRMLDDFLPKWRSMSAMHGGKLPQRHLDAA